MVKRKVEPAVVETVETSPTPADSRKDSFKGDPMWNTRRRGMTYVLSFCAGYLMLITGLAMFTNLGADKITALSGVVAALGVIASPILVAWFAVAEYGRVKGVLGTTSVTTTETAT